MKRVVIGLSALICAVLFLGTIGMLVPRPFSGGLTLYAPPDNPGPELRTFLLIKNAIHTDIAFPNDPDIRERLSFVADAGLQLANPEARWIVLGWGGRSFFTETPTWADLKAMPVLRALTVDRSVMHVSMIGTVNGSNMDTRSITLPAAQFEALFKAALAGFHQNEKGKPVLIKGAGYSAFDRFYEGTGNFNALIGCNTWTASVLRAGGIRTGWWNPLPVSLITSLEMWNKCAEGDDTCINAF
jgi:uncharacterized protein (TIGR02117 family)